MELSENKAELAEPKVSKSTPEDMKIVKLLASEITTSAFEEKDFISLTSTSKELTPELQEANLLQNPVSEVSSELPFSGDENLITEGKAEVIIPCHVFYNPVQEFNRDLSIAVLSVFSQIYQKEQIDKKNEKRNHKSTNRDPSIIQSDETSKTLQGDEKLAGQKYENGITILEALSATGLRSVRYAKEIPGVKKVVANDISLKAVESIKSTICRNNIEHIVQANHEDATMYMYSARKPESRFNAIDLDPYGCPSIFLDSAVQAITDGGLLLVTATDMAVLAGNSPETCYTKYGSISLHSTACHEMALRILLQCIQAHASRYGRYIVPLLSVSIDFYIRVFVRIYTSPKECKKITSKLALIHQCVACESREFQPLGILKSLTRNKNKKRDATEEVVKEDGNELKAGSIDNTRIKYSLPTERSASSECAHCKSKIHSGGPIWMAELHDQEFVSKVLTLCETESERFGTAKRLQGVLTVVSEELPDPLYYTLPKLCSTLHMQTLPILKFRSALLNAGKKVSFSHACKTSIKTDASAEFIWDILRAWQKDNPVNQKRLELDPAAANILSKAAKNNISFIMREDANPPSRKLEFSRFPPNPIAHWGPGTRGNVNKRSGEQLHKSIRNQNKKQKRSISEEKIISKVPFLLCDMNQA